jgi:hypothetical protein
VTINGKAADLMVGETLYAPAEIGNLLITSRDGRPVYVRDLADISFATDEYAGSSPRWFARKTAKVQSTPGRHAGDRQARRRQCGAGGRADPRTHRGISKDR